MTPRNESLLLVMETWSQKHTIKELVDHTCATCIRPSNLDTEYITKAAGNVDVEKRWDYFVVLTELNEHMEQVAVVEDDASRPHEPTGGEVKATVFGKDVKSFMMLLLLPRESSFEEMKKDFAR